MKRLLLLAFILFGSVAFGASISDGSRDHGAARLDLSNVDPTSSLAINNLEVSGSFRANPSVLENQYRFTMAMSWVRGDYPSGGVATYTDGPTHGQGAGAFFGSTLMPNGKVLLTPYNSANIGLYDPSDNSYTNGPAHGKGADAFYSSTLMPNGKVMLTPRDSTTISIYDPKLNVSAVLGLANYLRLPFFNKL